jgi:hypothetical protein
VKSLATLYTLILDGSEFLRNTSGESWLITIATFAQVVFNTSNLIRIKVDACKALAQEAVKTALDLEAAPYYTQNTHYLQTLREKWLAYYKTVRSRPGQYKARNQAPELGEDACEEISEAIPEFKFASPSRRSYPNYSMEESPVETPEDTALKALAAAGYSNLRVSDLARLLPPDSFEEELVVMADVRAYFNNAYKVSCAHSHHFKVLYPSSSVSSTIFLLQSSMLSIMPWQINCRRAFSRAS